MIVGVIGAPCSGKTTTAAMAFAALKETGVACEFVPEQARVHIARLRLALPPGQPLVLTDQDQLRIMESQLEMERMFRDSLGGGGVVITDTSAYLTLMYLSEDGRHHPKARRVLEEAGYDLLFHCPPVPRDGMVGQDPNRVHSLEDSLEIDRLMAGVFAEHVPGKYESAVRLSGSSLARHSTVMYELLRRLAS